MRVHMPDFCYSRDFLEIFDKKLLKGRFRCKIGRLRHHVQLNFSPFCGFNFMYGAIQHSDPTCALRVE